MKITQIIIVFDSYSFDVLDEGDLIGDFSQVRDPDVPCLVPSPIALLQLFAEGKQVAQLTAFVLVLELVLVLLAPVDLPDFLLDVGDELIELRKETEVLDFGLTLDCLDFAGQIVIIFLLKDGVDHSKVSFDFLIWLDFCKCIN